MAAREEPKRNEPNRSEPKKNRPKKQRARLRAVPKPDRVDVPDHDEEVMEPDRAERKSRPVADQEAGDRDVSPDDVEDRDEPETRGAADTEPDPGAGEVEDVVRDQFREAQDRGRRTGHENRPRTTESPMGAQPEVQGLENEEEEEEEESEDDPSAGPNIAEDMADAVGISYQNDEPLHTEDKLEQRDRHRWELDPASSEDYEERIRGEGLDEEEDVVELEDEGFDDGSGLEEEDQA